MVVGRVLARKHRLHLVEPPKRRDIVSDDLGVTEIGRPGVSRTTTDWEIEASALDELLRRVHDDYTRLPLFITENGAAFDDYVDQQGEVRDPERIEYLDGHLRAVRDAISAGGDVRGYFVWSLMDNFEWAFGYSKRFGVIWVDYATGKRVPKHSFAWYRDVVAANGLPAS
jgi:beta-glucosidase